MTIESDIAAELALWFNVDDTDDIQPIHHQAAASVMKIPAVEWAIRIASSELLFTNPRPPASACPPEVRAALRGEA